MKSNHRKTLILSSSDIEHIVKSIGLNAIMDRLISDLDRAFKDYDPQHTTIPVRAGFHYAQPAQGLIEWMPLYQHGEQVVLKMVGYHPDNPAQYNLPTIISTISNYDTSTGHLKGLVDGVFLTALRTGAASAVASKYLAATDSKVLGLIGCGAQSVTQLHALSRLFDFEKVLFYDVDANAVASFVDRVAMLNLNYSFVPTSMEKIVEQADIICTATSIDVGAGPLFNQLTTKEHLHINALGSDFPGKTELPLDLLKKSFVCPDFIAQAVVEGECQQLAREDINADLFECIKAPNKFEAVKDQRSVFDSTGLPLEDQVVMDLFLEYASDLGLGLEIEIENMSEDAKSPYHFMKIGVGV